MTENNIDLLKPMEYATAELDLNPTEPRRKRSVNVPDKKALKLREAKAKRFLCVMLSFVVVFVAVVCVFVNSNNKEILAQKELEAASNAYEMQSADVSVPAQTTQAPANAPAGSIVKITTTEPPSTTVEPTQESTVAPPVSLTQAQTAGATGTFNNPATVTDCSFETVVVNRNYRIPSSYEADLVYVCGSGERLQREVAKHYEEMYNAALNDGCTLTPCSGYRSYSTQETLYNRKIDLFTSQGYGYDEAKVKAAEIVMPPGSSEHNLGYAMDIVCVDEWFEDTKEFSWLMENAADYGFILRYPEDKQDVTKVIYEPWHWRYVGVETAKAIKASGLVMEEYYGKSAQ